LHNLHDNRSRATVWANSRDFFEDANCLFVSAQKFNRFVFR